MSRTKSNKENKNPEIIERTEQEILEEEKKNQQTIDIFIQSDRNWS